MCVVADNEFSQDGLPHELPGIGARVTLGGMGKIELGTRLWYQEDSLASETRDAEGTLICKL